MNPEVAAKVYDKEKNEGPSHAEAMGEVLKEYHADIKAKKAEVQTRNNEFETRVNEIMKRDNCTREEAIYKLSKEFGGNSTPWKAKGKNK